MTKLPTNCNLVTRVWPVSENRNICAADTGIEVLHQHIIVSDFRQR